MPRPTNIICPPGLEYLSQINQILVHQELEPIESKKTRKKFYFKIIISYISNLFFFFKVISG